jgi:hypothetical protein
VILLVSPSLGFFVYSHERITKKKAAVIRSTAWLYDLSTILDVDPYLARQRSSLGVICHLGG